MEQYALRLEIGDGEIRHNLIPASKLQPGDVFRFFGETSDLSQYYFFDDDGFIKISTDKVKELRKMNASKTIY